MGRLGGRFEAHTRFGRILADSRRVSFLVCLPRLGEGKTEGCRVRRGVRLVYSEHEYRSRDAKIFWKIGSLSIIAKKARNKFSPAQWRCHGSLSRLLEIATMLSIKVLSHPRE